VSSKTVVLIRAASLVALLQFVAHGTMFLRYAPKHGPAEAAVVEAMRSQSFNFGGSVRSYWDLYVGYGLLAAFTCLVEAVLLWQLAALVSTTSAPVRPILALIILANLGHIALCWRYFFFVPMIPDAAIAACLAAALVTLRA
jgi:hypothetical protein